LRQGIDLSGSGLDGFNSIGEFLFSRDRSVVVDDPDNKLAISDDTVCYACGWTKDRCASMSRGIGS
jgi:hypothetical protein